MAFSAFNRHIFKAFQYALGCGEIKNLGLKGSISASICSTEFMDTNRYNFSALNIRTKSLSSFTYRKTVTTETKGLKGWKGDKGVKADIKGLKGNLHRATKGHQIFTNTARITPTNLVLNNFTFNNFNRDTQLPSEITYEQITNKPCSAIIFSDGGWQSWVSNDLDYSPTALNDPYAEAYFKNEYNFNKTYVKSEYRTYDVNELILEENVQCISADDFIINDLSGNPTAMEYGAGGLLLSYTDDNHKDGEQIPIVYYEFPKSFYSNCNYLEVDWHADGILRVD